MNIFIEDITLKIQKVINVNLILALSGDGKPIQCPTMTGSSGKINHNSFCPMFPKRGWGDLLL